MKDLLPLRLWLLLVGLAVASVVLGLVRLWQSPFGQLNEAEKHLHLTGVRLDPGFSEWIGGYTGGVRSVHEPIRVQFTEPVDSIRQAQVVSDGVLSISPRVEGKLIWEDEYTLTLVPKNHLPYDEIFKVELNLSKVFTIQTDKYRAFSFVFQTMPLYGRIGGISFSENGGLKAEIRTTDYAHPEDIEKNTQFTDLPTTATWTHSNDGHVHTLALVDPRRAKAYTAAITFDAKAIGGKEKITEKVLIPEKGVFQVFTVEENNLAEHSLTIHFSYPLVNEQRLEALVYLENTATRAAQIAGCSVVLPLPSDLSGKQKLILLAGLKAQKGQQLLRKQVIDLVLRPNLPGLRMPGKGFIIPKTGDKAYLTFEARALLRAHVQLYRVFPSNIPEFLGRMDITQPSQSFYQRTLGRPVATIAVDLPENVSESGYEKYRIDISKYIAEEPDALHYARLNFRPEDMRYECPGVTVLKQGLIHIDNIEEEEENSYDQRDPVYGDEDRYYGDGDWTGQYRSYNYSEGSYAVNDALGAPCLQEYVYDPPTGLEGGRVQVGTYLLQSNLGLQVRVGSGGQVAVIATDLRTAEPIANIKTQVLSQQHQVIGEGTTNSYGILMLDLPKRPIAALVTAKCSIGAAYVSLANTAALDYSAFAEHLADGGVEDGSLVKGFVYTERGTYRPGDTLHVAFILQGPDVSLLKSPVVLTVTNAQGTEIYRKAKAETIGSHYRWNVPTLPTAPTGGYSIAIRAGDKRFYHTVGVETIRPNRMAIDYKLSAAAYLAGEEGKADIQAKYLYGSPASALKLSTRSSAKYVDFSPKKFESYNFRNYNLPEDNLNDKPGLILDGTTDAQGKATLPFIAPRYPANSPVSLTLTTQVFEQGGQFSQQFSTTIVHTAKAYLGIKEKTRPEAGSYALKQPVELEVVRIDAKREIPVGTSTELSYVLRRLDWAWWYESVRGTYYYNSGNTNEQVLAKKLAIPKGKATITLNLETWGRYALEVYDLETGHSTSQIIYVGSPDAEDKGDDPAQRLTLRTNKKLYSPGEMVTFYLPQKEAAEGDKVLVSFEAGNKSLAHTWAKVAFGAVKVVLPEGASPNCYAHITLLRPYGNASVGKPLRSYGVVGLDVQARDLLLHPVLSVPEEVKPSKPIAVTVSEKEGVGMTYVLAMVDEGLLNLTNFKTPNPALVLNGRRSLAVRSFDLFGHVLDRGLLTGRTVLATGGDAYAMMEAKSEEARNKLVVEAVSRVLGPFSLKPGEKANHTLEAPSYPGAVRWMLIANTAKTAASSEATTRVKADLILEATLPRIASMGDVLTLPVELESFVKGANSSSVEATLVSGSGKLLGKTKQIVPLRRAQGRKLTSFVLQAGNNTGLVVIKLKAIAGNAEATRIVRLPIRLPNRSQQKTQDLLIEAGQQFAWPRDLAGATPGPWKIEFATNPPLGLTDKLGYLIHYPYGCAEQTVSSAAAQLFLPKVVSLNPEAAQAATLNVKTAVSRLRGFELSSGMLSLWEGGAEADVEASAYACWFLQEAKEMGYGTSVQSPRLEKALKKYLEDYPTGSTPAERNLKAYVAYCLGSACKTAGLNRLVSDPLMPKQGRVLLAGAYVRRGDVFLAKNQLSIPATMSGPYDGAYASPIRDLAIYGQVEQSILHSNRSSAVSSKLLDLAKTVKNTYYLSTQELGFAFAALSSFPQSTNTAHLRIGSQMVAVGTQSHMLDVLTGKTKPVVTNTSKGAIYAHITQVYTPQPGFEPETSNGLKMDISYVNDLNRPLNPSTLEKGTRFSAVVTVTNNSGEYLSDLALAQPVAAGWEINNERLADNSVGTTGKSEDGLTHLDVRDDRIHRFFYLANQGQVTFRTQLTAAYGGKFVLPSIVVESMYKPQYQAIRKGGWVVVK